jgi:endonuclease YncB( thermonuclease family)
MIRLFSAVFLVVFSALSAFAWSGDVVGVSDGDTITVLRNGQEQVKVRLYGVDTPESKQAFGTKAKQFTAAMVHGQSVEVDEIDHDRYGRTVGLVGLLDGRSLNEELVRAGVAWVYTQYCKKAFCSDWAQLQREAQTAQSGLWADASPVPPWNWRKGQKDISKTPVAAGLILHGNVDSRIVHGPSCKFYNCKNCSATFQSVQEAQTAGYRLCKKCGGR